MSLKFKFKESDIDNVEKSVKDAFEKVIASKQLLNEVGEIVITDIKEQTRVRGKSIPNKLADLKLLKEAWIKRRTKLASSNNVDRDFEDGRSNLTFTGQLLNSLSSLIPGPGKLRIYLKGIHKAYRNQDGEKISRDLSNEKLAEYVEKQGRPFLGVRRVITNRINRLVRTYVRRALRVKKLFKD